MTLQRRLLHAMLGLLALAAAAGVSTIFVPSGDLLFRVAGTLVLAAVAIGLAIPTSRLLSVQSERTRGLVTLLAIVVGFCLSLSATWYEFLFNSVSEDLILTTFAYVVTAAPGLAFYSLWARPEGRDAGIVGMGFAAAVLASWLVAIWGRRLGFGASKEWVATAGLIALAGVPIAACLFGARESGRAWRYGGAVAGAIGLAMGLYGTWVFTGAKPTNVVHCIIFAAAVGGANVLTRLSMPPNQVWLRLTTCWLIIVTGGLGMVVNSQVQDGLVRDFDNVWVRLLTASSIVTACGVLAIVVLMAFNRRFVVTESRSIADITSMTVHCPRCSRKQAAALGECSCQGCNLIFLIRVAEPRCRKCNYPLLDIRSGRCPECGEPIPGASPDPQRVPRS